MPAPKRIKCAGQADEQLIADLENQLENRANEIYENDEVYRYHDQDDHQHREDDEEWPIWAYIGIGMIIGLILVFGWFLFLRAEPEVAVAPTEPTTGTQEPAYNTQQIGYGPNGAIDKTNPPKERSLVKDYAPIAAAAAGVGGMLAYQHNVGGIRDKTQSLFQKVKEPEVHIPTAGECRAQGQILNGDKCVETTWSENPREKVGDAFSTAADKSVEMIDYVGGGAAGLVNQIPGVDVDPQTMQVSSYTSTSSWGKYAVLGVSTLGLYCVGNYLYQKYWKGEKPNGDPTDCGGLKKCVPECSNPLAGATKKAQDCATGVFSPFKRAWSWTKQQCTDFYGWRFFWPVVVAGLGSLVWFLPALAALLPGSAQTMLAPATGLINQGKGAILGMMEPSGPLLGTP